MDLSKMDWDLLRKQKSDLFIIQAMVETEHPEKGETLEGLLGLIDAVQDAGAEIYGEQQVFGREFTSLLD